MKKYKVKNIFGETYILDRKELFDYVDEIKKYIRVNNFRSLKYICSSNIILSGKNGSFTVYKKQVEIKRYCGYRGEYFYSKEIEKIYASHFLEIRDRHGYSIDIDELNESYLKSRGLKNKKSKFRKAKKYTYSHLVPAGWKSEFSQNIKAKEHGVNIRSKREKKIVYYLSKNYDKYTRKNMGKTESWKNKKIKKQYLKNQNNARRFT